MYPYIEMPYPSQRGPGGRGQRQGRGAGLENPQYLMFRRKR